MTTTPRSIDDGPWCWLAKEARRRVREELPHSAVASALAVLSALAEVASDNGAESFVTTHAWLSFLSGLSPRTIQDRLKDLVAVDLLALETPKLKAPSRYTLLRAPGCAITAERPAIIAERSASMGGAPLPTYKEKKNNNTRKPSAPTVKASRKGHSRERDPIIDALAAIECPDLRQVPASAWSRFATARKEIVTVSPDVTPAEITRRLAAYRRAYPTIRSTAKGLASHWGEFPPSTNSATNGPTFV